MISVKQWISLTLFYLVYLLVGAAIFMFVESEHETENLKELRNVQQRLSLSFYFIEDSEIKIEIMKCLEELENRLGRNLLLPRNYQNLLRDHVKSLETQLRYSHDYNSTNNSSEALAVIKMEDLILSNETTYNIAVSTNATHEDLLVYSLEHPDMTSLQTDNRYMGDDVPPTATPIRSRLQSVQELLAKSEIDGDLIEREKMWTLWNSFIFAFTDITTIGFGHMAPRTESGQIFCILYSIVGVPLNGIVFAHLADLFACKFITRLNEGRYEKTSRIFMDAIFYTIPGVLIFFFAPAIIFMYIEDWSYTNSFYFTFVTLSTIGFGDLVAGYPKHSGGWIWPYRICIFAWILFGLGYLLMIIAFIQKAFRSKQLRAFDRKITSILKQSAVQRTSKDLRTEVLKLAKVLNTIESINKMEELESELNKDQESKDDTDDNISTTSDKSDIIRISVPSTKHSSKAGCRRNESNADIFLKIAQKILKDEEDEEMARKNRISNIEDSVTGNDQESTIGHGVDEEAAYNYYEEHKTSKYLVSPTKRRSSIWSDLSVLPDIQHEEELELPDTLSDASKRVIQRRHSTNLLTGSIDNNPMKIGTLTELIDRVEEVLENDISKPEDFSNISNLKLKPKVGALQVASQIRKLSIQKQQPDHNRRRSSVADLFAENPAFIL